MAGFWFLAVALVVVMVATVVCLLKGRRIYGLMGVGASILVAALLFEAREVDEGTLEAASLFLGFVFFGLTAHDSGGGRCVTAW
jgi:hypothetical protein